MSDFIVFVCGVYPEPCFEELIDASVSLGLRDLMEHIPDFRLDYDPGVSWLRHFKYASMQYKGLITLNS